LWLPFSFNPTTTTVSVSFFGGGLSFGFCLSPKSGIECFLVYFELISTLDAGYLLKKSGKGSGWSRRWFVLNEKTGKVSKLFHSMMNYTVQNCFRPSGLNI